MQPQTDARPGLLVIDDDQGPRESIRLLFKHDYNVRCAESVDAGLALLKQEPADVIIMDIKMPGRSGIDGLREIRGLDEHVSVIMLTGYGSLDTAQQAIRLGANDYLKKPFDTQKISQTVAHYARRATLARKRAQTTLELQQLNEQLRQRLLSSEHLASLGQASSEFVHDLRNPLTVICGSVELLMEKVTSAGRLDREDAGEAMEYLDIIAKNARRCQEMSRLWRDLGKPETARLTLCDLSALVDEAAKAARRRAAEFGTTITVRSDAEPCPVRVDRLQLSRALENILANALEAVPVKGGRVDISWRRAEDCGEVSVEDNGCGIPAEAGGKVFEPHYTTKGASGGMGIGLFITKRIIEDTHGGSIDLRNRASGPGVRVRVRLPLAEGAERQHVAFTC